MLDTIKSTFECDFTSLDRVAVLNHAVFSDGVGDALRCTAAMPVYQQVRHELTVLQVWCKAQKACATVATDRFKATERKGQQINEQREKDFFLSKTRTFCFTDLCFFLFF